VQAEPGIPVGNEGSIPHGPASAMPPGLCHALRPHRPDISAAYGIKPKFAEMMQAFCTLP